MHFDLDTLLLIYQAPSGPICFWGNSKYLHLHGSTFKSIWWTDAHYSFTASQKLLSSSESLSTLTRSIKRDAYVGRLKIAFLNWFSGHMKRWPKCASWRETWAPRMGSVILLPLTLLADVPLAKQYSLIAILRAQASEIERWLRSQGRESERELVNRKQVLSPLWGECTSSVLPICIHVMLA